MEDSRIRTAAELISALVSPKAAEAAEDWARFVGVWPSLVGEHAAAHSRIVDVVNNSVLVEVDHPGWTQRLQFRQSGILRAIQKGFPSLNLRGIQFRLAKEGQAGGGMPVVTPEKRVLSSSEAASLPTLRPDSIADDRLREALSGLRDAMNGKDVDVE